MNYDLITLQECPAGSYIKLSASDNKVYTIGRAYITSENWIGIHLMNEDQTSFQGILPATTKVLLLNDYSPKDDSVDLTEDEPADAKVFKHLKDMKKDELFTYPESFGDMPLMLSQNKHRKNATKGIEICVIDYNSEGDQVHEWMNAETVVTVYDWRNSEQSH